jgi:ABC-2 type transport system ATP-binding protein
VADAISTENLAKTFRKRGGWWPFGKRASAEEQARNTTRALDGVNLTIGQGEFFGLLGPNGAGKTTLVKCLATLLLPDSGTARIMGYDTLKDSIDVRSRIGLATGGERALYWKLSPRSNLVYFAALYGMTRSEANKRIDFLLDLMELTSNQDVRIEKFSSGMRQKMSIARALLHDPPVLLLDEPTIGLDPVFSRSLRDFLRDTLNRKMGKTILLTTHNMEEAEKLCDRIAIVNKGKVQAVDTPANLKNSVPFERILRMKLKGEIDIGAFKALQGVSDVSSEKVDGTWQVRLHGNNLESIVDQAIGAARKSAGVLSVEVSEPTLEDVFAHLTGAKLKTEECN